MISLFSSFGLRSVVGFNFDAGCELRKLSDPILESGSWDENEMGTGVSLLLQMGQKGNDLDRLSKTCDDSQ